jgi:hypothetical protein
MVRELRERLARERSELRASPTMELRRALIEWRAAERAYVTALLQSAHPLDLHRLLFEKENRLQRVREVVDSEPWADIAAGL